MLSFEGNLAVGLQCWSYSLNRWSRSGIRYSIRIAYCEGFGIADRIFTAAALDNEQQVCPNAIDRSGDRLLGTTAHCQHRDDCCNTDDNTKHCQDRSELVSA